MALVRVGASHNWGRRVLARVEPVYRSRHDGEPGERVSWRNDVAEAWSLVDCPDRARGLVREALRLSAATGSRKDYQLDEWINWTREANASDSARSVERVRTMLGAVVGMAEYADGRMTDSASLELIRAAMEWSPVGAAKLGSTLAETGATSYVHVLRSLIIEGLRRDSTPYQVAQAIASHLVIPIATDADPELLKQLLRAVNERGGRGPVDLCVSTLRYAIDVLALPAARAAWMSGLRAGLLDCGLNPSEFGTSSTADDREAGGSEHLRTVDAGRWHDDGA